MTKPLGHRAYGSIPHLPGSKLGKHDKYITDRQGHYLTVKIPTKNHRVVVQEKLDGSCVAVVRRGHEILPIGRAGYPIGSSPYAHLQRFGAWVREREPVFRDLLQEGERVVGEWMFVAISTRYTILGEDALFRPFDLMVEHRRAPALQMEERTRAVGLHPVTTWLHERAVSLDEAWRRLRLYRDGACEREVPEGLVYRMEHKGEVDYLAKWVRPDHEPGALLDNPPENPIERIVLS